ncbi:HNH endonuclease [Gemmatimonas sp.]|uniref:HNH endonuclease n=1 Tax=Gemmatimonas sp. TaxID=1962908 RepID=UPI00356276A8
MRNPAWTRDELILALNLYMHADRKVLDATHPFVIELSETLNGLGLHGDARRGEAFRNVNGVCMKLANFSAIDPLKTSKGLERGNRLEQVVWDDFADDATKLNATALLIRETSATAPVESLIEVDPDEEFPEGKLLTRLHRMRERNPALVKRKKQAVLASLGALACECCAFDFFVEYGPIGEGFAECHHRTPVSRLAPDQRTKLADVALVCANCHRMLHRARPVLTVEQLRDARQQIARE